MTTPQPNHSQDDPTPAIPGFQAIAVHLSQQISFSPFEAVVAETPSLPEYLFPPVAAANQPAQSSPRSDVNSGAAARQAEETLDFHDEQILVRQREPLHHRDRFAGDPRDDVRLQWADESTPWWHFDVEARMVDRETLWIMEKLEALQIGRASCRERV